MFPREMGTWAPRGFHVPRGKATRVPDSADVSFRPFPRGSGRCKCKNAVAESQLSPLVCEALGKGLKVCDLRLSCEGCCVVSRKQARWHQLRDGRVTWQLSRPVTLSNSRALSELSAYCCLCKMGTMTFMLGQQQLPAQPWQAGRRALRGQRFRGPVCGFDRQGSWEHSCAPLTSCCPWTTALRVTDCGDPRATPTTWALVQFSSPVPAPKDRRCPHTPGHREMRSVSCRPHVPPVACTHRSSPHSD